MSAVLHGKCATTTMANTHTQTHLQTNSSARNCTYGRHPVPCRCAAAPPLTSTPIYVCGLYNVHAVKLKLKFRGFYFYYFIELGDLLNIKLMNKTLGFFFRTWMAAAIRLLCLCDSLYLCFCIFSVGAGVFLCAKRSVRLSKKKKTKIKGEEKMLNENRQNPSLKMVYTVLYISKCVHVSVIWHKMTD